MLKKKWFFAVIMAVLVVVMRMATPVMAQEYDVESLGLVEAETSGIVATPYGVDVAAPGATAEFNAVTELVVTAINDTATISVEGGMMVPLSTTGPGAAVDEMQVSQQRLLVIPSDGRAVVTFSDYCTIK